MALLDPAFVATVLLVFVRIGGVMMTAPPFRQGSVPVVLRVLLAVLLAYGLAGFVKGPLPLGFAHPVGFTAALVIEGLTGALLGFIVRFVFFAVEFAADVIGYQMSLAMAQVFNPIEGTSSNPLGQFLSMGFLLLFLLLDGPQSVLRGLALSFEAIPLGGANLPAAGPLLLEAAGVMFASALRLAAPFMVAMLLVDIALSVFARVVPQADFFSLGLPLKLLAGLALAGLFVETFGVSAVELVARAGDDLVRMVEVLAG